MAIAITPDAIDTPNRLLQLAAEFVDAWTQVANLDDPMPHLACDRNTLRIALAFLLWNVSFTAKHGNSPDDAEYTEARDTFAAIAAGLREGTMQGGIQS